jgi:long-chain acyl-CoA synthetase
MGSETAFYWRGQEFSYADFFDRVDAWRAHLATQNIQSGTVCAVYGDYAPGTITLIYALMIENAIIVPLTPAVENEMARFIEIAGVEMLYRFDETDAWTQEWFPNAQGNDLVENFATRNLPGLIVFTSGSTGEPKGILHDCERVMRKFITERPGWRTVLFLLMDHFGGFNTLLGVFAYGGVGVCVDQRSPEVICEAIDNSTATLLPTTPTFLNMIIASGAWERFNLSSIKMITYGTEVMPETTLERVCKIFPNARIKQTYGLSELGVLRSKSNDEGSTWVKVGGDGFEIKIVDGLLWIKSEANMVGYLNAPDPFDADGWMCTGDEVEIKGDMIRFVGRRTEIINVGGQKVFPVEVEGVLLNADNVREATVFAVSHPLLGQAVAARITVSGDESEETLKRRIRDHCRKHLSKYKIPMRIEFVAAGDQSNQRFKKIRNVK